VRTLAHALRRQGHLTRPLELFKDVLADYAASGDKVGAWQTLRFIGQTHLDRGDVRRARQALEASENIAVELGNPRLIAQTSYWIGQTCLVAGDLDGAQVAFDSVYDVFQDDTGIGQAYARHGIGEMSRLTGELTVAEQHLAAAAERAHEVADASLEGRVWLSIAELRLAQGRPDQQIEALARAVRVLADGGAARLEVRALAALARAKSEQGDHEAARLAWVRITECYDAAELPAQDRLAQH
jgi:tetratricopeptide (TPR) repeat protein